MILLAGRAIDLVLVLAFCVIFSLVIYGLVLLVLSRFEPVRSGSAARSGPGGEDWRSTPVIFMLPCLNEGSVLGASLRRLTALEHERLLIVVVDDGSDDETAAVARAHPDPRVLLLQRTLPEARQGKGEALNAAVVRVRQEARARGWDASEAVVCVVDADGRLEPHVLEHVLPMFADPELGAVQIGVRINNRRDSLLARMQDLEFVLYTEVFQRGRRHLNTVGLGGNGQFVRLSALNSLGVRPWSRSLTEDLDMGVRLLMNNWRTDFQGATAVHQQGLVSLSRWIRQRTRWFQGHLQSWPLVPQSARGLTGSKRLDLLYHLTSPALLLIASLLTIAFGLWIVGLVASALLGSIEFSPWWVVAYLIAVGPMMLAGMVYWQREWPTLWGLLRTVALVHLYVLYGTLWYIAGWRAVWRMARGDHGWAKTERNQESPDALSDELLPGPVPEAQVTASVAAEARHGRPVS